MAMVVRPRTRLLSGRVLRAGGILVPAALFLALSAGQAIPLPAPVLRLVAPATHDLYARTLPGFPGDYDPARIEGFLLGDPSAPPFAIAGEGVQAPAASGYRTLSIYAAGTRDRVGLLLAFFLLFLAAAEYARDEGRRRRLLLAVTMNGFAIAAFALVQKMTWNGRIFWLRIPTQGGEPFGPFVNRNHFAGYMELVLPISLGLLLTVWRHRSSRPAPEDRVSVAATGVIRFPRLEENKASLFAGWGEAAVPKTILIVFALALSIIAILTSGSRGGLLATLITFVLFAGALVPSTFRRKSWLIASIAGAGILSILLLARSGYGPVGNALERIGQAGAEPTYASRWVNWTAMLPLIRDHLLAGTGLGTFRQAYAGYYPPGVLRVWSQAHNDYLQVLVETGLAGGILLLLVIVAYARKTFVPGLRAPREREICLGLAMALVSLALHSLVDFNLQIPSNGFLTVLLAATLAGIVAEARERRGRTRDVRSEPGIPGPDEATGGAMHVAERRRPNGRQAPVLQRRLAAAGGAILLLACCVASARRFLGDRAFVAAQQSLDSRRFELAVIQLRSAAAWDPGRAEIQGSLGDTLIDLAAAVPGDGAGSREAVHALLQDSLGAYLRFLDASPAEAWAWSGIASVYDGFALATIRPAAIDLSRFADRAPGRQAAGPDPGIPARGVRLAAITKAVELEPAGFEFLEDRASWFLDSGREAEGLADLRQAAFLAPSLVVHNWGAPPRWSPEWRGAVEAGMREALESNPLVAPDEVWKNLGQIALEREEWPEAAALFKSAVDTAPDALMRRVHSFYMAEALARAGRMDAAVAAYTEATKEPLVEAHARSRLGMILLDRGMGEEAFLELRTAVHAAPGDVRVRMALADVASRTGRMDVALDSLEAAVRLSPRDPEPLRQMVEAYRKQGDMAAANAAARRLVEGWPDVAVFKELLRSVEAGPAESRKEPAP